MNRVERLSNHPKYAFVEGWYDLANADHFWMQWRLRAFWRQALDLRLPFDAPWRGLDIGCGAGVVARQIEERSRWTVDGADLNEDALARHEQRRGRVLFYDVLDRRKELEARYDFLMMFDVLEHHAEPGDFLSAAIYHLRPGGWMFLNVPALRFLWSAYDEANGHFRRYDRRSLPAELGAHPLAIRDLRYWGASMVPLLLLRKLFVSRTKGDPETIRRGFQPPGAFAHAILKMTMKIETSLCARPFAGGSLLAAAVKK